jgi:TrmH family RNA methyltransferase
MITASSNQQIKQLQKWMSKSSERAKDGIFLAEGLRLVSEAPAELVRTLYVTPKVAEEGIPEKLRQIPTEVVSPELFSKISSTDTPQGILAVVKRPTWDPEEILKRDDPFLVVCERMQDPGNLGTVFRTAEAAGVSALYMSRDAVDPYNPKVVRSTMGAIFRVPHFIYNDYKVLAETFRKREIRTYAAHLRGTLSYTEADFRGGSAVLIGNEGNGLSEETAAMADTLVKIPMAGQAESLNASVAAALLMYEGFRKRNFK